MRTLALCIAACCAASTFSMRLVVAVVPMTHSISSKSKSTMRRFTVRRSTEYVRIRQDVNPANSCQVNF